MAWLVLRCASDVGGRGVALFQLMSGEDASEVPASQTFTCQATTAGLAWSPDTTQMLPDGLRCIGEPARWHQRHRPLGAEYTGGGSIA